jgi:AraC-like DNA-binding protein
LIICIQKMTSPIPAFSRYLALSPELATWGLGVTAAGLARIPPGASYPPPAHPIDHDFRWERGRRLEAFQIILITAGQGWFETAETGPREVKAGSAVMLFPKVWHRYRPDPATGWEEKWIEIRGPILDALLRAGIVSPADPLRSHVLATGLEEVIDELHQGMRHARPGFDPEFSGHALRAIALWQRAAGHSQKRTRLMGALVQAEHILSDRLAESVNVEKLAQKLGIAYSHFRRAFKKHTGFAPWQYVLHQRLSRARRLLSSGDSTLEDIAERLGFSSGFHLSTAFKQAYGISPDRWRRQFAAEAGAAASPKSGGRRRKLATKVRG